MKLKLPMLLAQKFKQNYSNSSEYCRSRFCADRSSLSCDEPLFDHPHSF